MISTSVATMARLPTPPHMVLSIPPPPPLEADPVNRQSRPTLFSALAGVIGFWTGKGSTPSLALAPPTDGTALHTPPGPVRRRAGSAHSPRRARPDPTPTPPLAKFPRIRDQHEEGVPMSMDEEGQPSPPPYNSCQSSPAGIPVQSLPLGAGVALDQPELTAQPELTICAVVSKPDAEVDDGWSRYIHEYQRF